MTKCKNFQIYKANICFSNDVFWQCLLSVNPLECVLMNNQECKVRPEIVNVDNSNPMLHPFIIKTSKCSGSCNNINDPYAKMCVPDVIKNFNIKVFNLLSRTYKTRNINGMELVNVNVDQIQVLVSINSAGMKINVAVNVKN